MGTNEGGHIPRAIVVRNLMPILCHHFRSGKSGSACFLLWNRNLILILTYLSCRPPGAKYLPVPGRAARGKQRGRGMAAHRAMPADGQPLRSRKPAAPSDAAADSETRNDRHRLPKLKRSHLSRAPLLSVAFLILLGLGLFIASPGQQKQGLRVFETADLEAAAARQDPLLLVVTGRVYNVSAGSDFYSKGSSYSGFANGIDATRAFLTADFENDASDDLSNLTLAQCAGVEHWANFYANSTKYTWVGVHHGRYYTATGEPTEELRAFQQCALKAKQVSQETRERVKGAQLCSKERVTREDTGRRAVQYVCDAPLVPQRCEIPDVGQKCYCFEGPTEDLGPDDGLSIRPYPGCARDASTCIVGGG
eukprot:6172813-Pleurochrysis_carterae.AAC.4